jgi:hypothetical protein
LAIAIGIVATIAVTPAQVPQMPKNVLRVRESIPVKFVTTPNGMVTAIVGGQEPRPLFVFCLANAKPQPLNWSGTATVTYEVMGQIPGFSPSPDQLAIGSGVAILPANGAGWLIEGPERKAPVRPEDRSKAATSTSLKPNSIRMAPAPRLSFCANVPGGG